MKKLYAVAFLIFVSLTVQAQLNGTGFYRFRNAYHTQEYISMANDKFNYLTAISTACGGLGQATSEEGQARALECAGKYLETDIHMVMDADCIDPGSVVYADKKNNNSSNYDYNLIGQGTSLLTLTTAIYDGTYDLTFEDRYITIEKQSGSGANTLYTAKIELKSSSYVLFVGYPSLGTRYLVDDNGKLAINASNSAQNAKWYIEPVTHFNVQPEFEFGGKFYTTLYVPYAFKLSGQVEKAYAVSAIGDDGTVEIGDAIATTGGTVPAGTPVILECASGATADCQLIPTGSPIFTAPQKVNNSDAPKADTITTNYTGTNILKGTYFCNQDGNLTFATPSGTGIIKANHFTLTSKPQKYVLGITESGKLGFVKATGTAMPANKAWLEYTGTAELVLPIEASKPGDVNHDGYVTIADVTALVNIILGKVTEENNPDDYDFKAANVNGDSEITIADVTALVNIILGKE